MEHSQLPESDRLGDILFPDLSDDATSTASRRLTNYTTLVGQWSQKLNLVGPREAETFWEKHIVPSLALRPALLAVPHDRIVDVGSGAGLPGIPLAISIPTSSVTLVESRRKRANFLRHVSRALSLSNVDVVCARVEDWQPGWQADVVVSRAVTSPTNLSRLSRHISTPHGCLLVTRGPDSEHAEPPPSVALTTIHGNPTPNRYLMFHTAT